MSRLRPDHRRRTGAVAVVLLWFVGCSSEAPVGPAPPTELAPETDDVPEEDLAPPSALRPPSERERPLPEDESDPRPVAPPRATERSSGDFPRWSDDVVHLVDARLIEHGNLDRLVLEFDGPPPSWQVTVGTGPLTEQVGRSEVLLEGDSVLELRLVPATSIDRAAAEPLASYAGPSHLVSEGGAIREALLTGDSSDILVWGVGVAGSPSFAIGTLEDPDRLVVDVLEDAR